MSHKAPTSSHPAELADYRWLVSPQAVPWLTWAVQSTQPLTTQVTHLRSHLTAAQTHLVLEQATLRRRATEKFSDADQLFFTPRALEQATDEMIAAHKATRFAGAGKIVDLCCGIGGDLMALAQQGTATGLDRDPIMSLLAEANGRARLDATRAPRVRCADVSTLDPAESDAWHIDPDRRPRGRRTTRVELHEPGVDVIERLLEQCPAAAIKLAPAATLPPAWHDRAELEWIGRDRQCRQLVAWFGPLALRPTQRLATILSNNSPPRVVMGRADVEMPVASTIGPFLFEPHAAVLAANLHGALANGLGLCAIAYGAVYLSGDRPLADPALSCFEVEEVLPFDLRRLKSLLRARDIGRLEIKLRGLDQDPADLRRRLAPQGEHDATLLITRQGKNAIAILAQRCTEAEARGN